MKWWALVGLAVAVLATAHEVNVHTTSTTSEMETDGLSQTEMNSLKLDLGGSLTTQDDVTQEQDAVHSPVSGAASNVATPTKAKQMSSKLGDAAGEIQAASHSKTGRGADSWGDTQRSTDLEVADTQRSAEVADTQRSAEVADTQGVAELADTQGGAELLGASDKVESRSESNVATRASNQSPVVDGYASMGNGKLCVDHHLTANGPNWERQKGIAACRDKCNANSQCNGFVWWEDFGCRTYAKCDHMKPIGGKNHAYKKAVAPRSGASDWCGFAGTYNLIYSNGHRNTFTIQPSGAVTSTNPSGKGTLQTSTDAKCPDQANCARLQVYAAHVVEFLSVDKSGKLTVQHYNPGHCCTGSANRQSRPAACPGTAIGISGTAKLKGQEQYGYKDGRELHPDVIERLDGFVNVASLAAGATLANDAKFSETYGGVCSPRDGWSKEVGVAEGWSGVGYRGWCYKQWCGKVGCNTLDGVYNWDPSHGWQPAIGHNRCIDCQSPEMSLKIKFGPGEHVPEIVSVFLKKEHDAEAKYKVEFTYPGGGVSQPLWPEPSGKDKRLQQYRYFKLIAIPAVLQKPATGAIFTIYSKMWKFLPSVNVASVDVWAKATKPIVQFWNPIVPLKINGQPSRWHQFMCDDMKSVHFDDMHFKVAPDSKGSEVSNIPDHTQNCIGNVIGGWIGYKTVKRPLCAFGPHVPGCGKLNCPKPSGLLKSAQRGGKFKPDEPVARTLCRDPKVGTYSDIWNGKLLAKAHCKIVKKTACKFCSTKAKKEDGDLDKTIRCFRTKTGRQNLQQCRVKKVCTCEYKDPEDGKNKPCMEGNNGSWQLQELTEICQTQCGFA